MGKLSRNKGANFEREIANEFRKHGFEARRGGGAQSYAADIAPDVVLEDLPGIWIECKKGAKTYPLKALKQAKEACGNATPVAICRDDREKSIVTIELRFFCDLLSKTFPDVIKVLEQETPEHDSDILPETSDDVQTPLFPESSEK
jgi:hypothetical protein